MVGRRSRAVYWSTHGHKARPVFPCRRRVHAALPVYRDYDVEAARRSSSDHDLDRTKVTKKSDFKHPDALAAEERRRADLKQKVLDGMRGFDLGELDRKFRKSDEELKRVRNKKLRHFHQAQNETLDAWIEVDAVVYAVADDIIESMVNFVSS
ncbi:hypothetical protein VTK26DRAFT_3956 [Humicola hyalothermophila]